MRNPTLETNLDRLSRYGFRREPSGLPVAAQDDWARLKGDFADVSGGAVPDLDDLPPETRTAAQHYLDLKNEADRLLSACETAHRDPQPPAVANTTHCLVQLLMVESFKGIQSDFSSGDAQEDLVTILRLGAYRRGGKTIR